jgi:hypothetical protein
MRTSTSPPSYASSSGASTVANPQVSNRAKTERNVPESHERLQQALRTLRAIGQRYEIDRARNPDGRSFTLKIALGCGDMRWISAVIELLEKSTATATDSAGAAER